MSAQSIQSQDISIADVFQGFYSVPEYQREFVWQSEQVELLLSDIHGEMSGSNPESAAEYFIGSIVVCPGKDGVLDLIDGQQRMTTIFLALCAIRDRIKELGGMPPGALGAQISTTSSDDRGRDVFRDRLVLQYEDSGTVLLGIAREMGESANGVVTRSIENIKNAYATIKSFLAQQFGSETDEIRRFYGYFTKKVKLIRIQTEDVAKALKIFETINDRGVGLDSMDLLKNLLFMKTVRKEFEALGKVWKELQDTIHDAHEKPLRFLRYFIFSRFSVEALKEDETYGWLSKNQKLCGYEEHPVAFAKELLDAAKAYAGFMKGRDPSGRERPELQSLQFLGGSAARQHLVLLLAGRHLPEGLLRILIKEVENLFFIYVVSRENTRDFERNFAKWAPELRAVKTEEDLRDFLRLRIEPSKAALSDRFDDAFKRMSSGDLQIFRLRYILAKLNQYIEMKAYGETERTSWLRDYTDSEFQIEHIQPINPSSEAVEEFGVPADPGIINRLGNLVLVERSINGSLGNKPFSKKRPVYTQSKILFVHAISDRPKIGSNTSVDRAVRELEYFSDWNETSVLSRQALIGRLAREIWGLASPA